MCSFSSILCQYFYRWFAIFLHMVVMAANCCTLGLMHQRRRFSLRRKLNPSDVQSDVINKMLCKLVNKVFPLLWYMVQKAAAVCFFVANMCSGVLHLSVRRYEYGACSCLPRQQQQENNRDPPTNHPHQQWREEVRND